MVDASNTPKLKALIFEFANKPLNAYGIESTYRDRGFEPVHARSTAEALRHLEENIFHAVSLFGIEFRDIKNAKAYLQSL